MCGSAVAEDGRSRVQTVFLSTSDSVPSLISLHTQWEPPRLLSYLFKIAKWECISPSVAAFCQDRLERD